MAGFGLPAGLVLRLLLLLHVGGGLAAPVLVVDLDHLFPWRLIAPLRLCRWLRSRTLAFATGHSPTVHRPAASTRKRALEMRYGRRRHGDAITTDARDYRPDSPNQLFGPNALLKRCRSCSCSAGDSRFSDSGGWERLSSSARTSLSPSAVLASVLTRRSEGSSLRSTRPFASSASGSAVMLDGS